jgi:beta-phosphoglucomutase
MDNKNIKAILFDGDGVLFEARETHYEALNKALAKHGFEISRNEHLERYDGKTTRTKLVMLTQEKNLSPELYDQIFADKQKFTNELFETSLSIDQSKIDLINRLKSSGYLVGICSNAIRKSVDTMAEKIGITNLVDVILGNEDSSKPKPAPDIYLKAAEMLGIDIKECVIVEDSDVGMASAIAADPYRIVRVTGPSMVNLNLYSSLIDESLDNQYSIMQRVQQDDEAEKWTLEQRDYIAGPFEEHNLWPDSQLFLFKDLEIPSPSKALDFGCGFGRCISLYRDMFDVIDGVDISSVGLIKAREYLSHEGVQIPNLYLTNGVDLKEVPSNVYDTVYSIICLQHICVHEIRFGLMKEFFRVLKPGGYFTAQMGYGSVHPKSVGYYDNQWDASGTNGSMDCRVESPEQLEKDLLQIGFANFNHWIRPVGPADIHENWIFFRAQKL